MIIQQDMSMARAILENNRLISLLPRFKIELGFGEKTVGEVCRMYDVNVDFFLEIVNSYVNEEYTPQNDLTLFSLSSIVEYLKNTHAIYLEEELPHVEAEIRELICKSELSQDKKDLVVTFFNDYKQEFIEHIMKEEDEVLPYILEVEKQYEARHPDPEFLEKLKHYSIHEFAREHDRLEDSLSNLAKLIIKYLPPLRNRQLCNQILSDLFALVNDLIDHAAMEDKILVPKVAEIEQYIKQQSS